MEAFLEAIQFFRQEKGHYGMWEMLTGNEKEVKEYIPDGVFDFWDFGSLRIVKIIYSLDKKGHLKKQNLVDRNTWYFKTSLTHMLVIIPFK